MVICVSDVFQYFMVPYQWPVAVTRISCDRYDTGTGAAVLRSPEEVKQGEWIKIAGMRQMRDGTLRVNDGE